MFISHESRQYWITRRAESVNQAHNQLVSIRRWSAEADVYLNAVTKGCIRVEPLLLSTCSWKTNRVLALKAPRGRTKYVDATKPPSNRAPKMVIWYTYENMLKVVVGQEQCTEQRYPPPPSTGGSYRPAMARWRCRRWVHRASELLHNPP